MSQAVIQDSKFKAPNSLWWMIGILLLAAAFRFLAIGSAPPGWRDDELIEFNMDRRIADGWRPLFITEAEGHEPFYHYLHAGTILLFGGNVIGYKWLPFAFGLLTISLTFALARRMFGARVAVLAAALLAVSFWPIMYSRFGVRHIGVLPLMLGAFYLLYPSFSVDKQGRIGVGALAKIVLAGILLATALMTYFAGRAVPIVLVGFLGYLLVFHRSIFKRLWWRYLLAIGLAVLIALPMFIEISRTPGGEKRTEVVGGPLIELRKGNIKPALETTLDTLGMFTFAGDPEWLYNVEHRPVFDWITGFFFYLGALLCLVRLKRVEYGFAAVWLLIGIAPAFVSIPAASFSHTIAAQPVVYILAAVGVVEMVDKVVSRQGNKKLALSTYLLVSLFVIGLGSWLTLRDYFGTWANEYIVRFQYHAPTREVARWLDQHSGIDNVAIGTNLNELTLDPLALKLDLKRDDVKTRWFSPEMALVIPSAGGALIFSPMQSLGDDIGPWVAALESQDILQRLNNISNGLRVYFVNPQIWRFRPEEGLPVFDASIGLLGGGPMSVTASSGDQVVIQTLWWSSQPISDPMLKSFVHVLNARNEVVAGNDRFDVNAASLLSGDYVGQFSHVTLPPDLMPGKYEIEVGLYHPDTGTRLRLPNGRDHAFINPLEVIAP